MEPGACGPRSRPSAICRACPYPQRTACVRGRWDGEGPGRAGPSQRDALNRTPGSGTATVRPCCGWRTGSVRAVTRGSAPPLRQAVRDCSGAKTRRPGIVPGPSASRRLGAGTALSNFDSPFGVWRPGAGPCRGTVKQVPVFVAPLSPSSPPAAMRATLGRSHRCSWFPQSKRTGRPPSPLRRTCGGTRTDWPSTGPPHRCARPTGGRTFQGGQELLGGRQGTRVAEASTTFPFGEVAAAAPSTTCPFGKANFPRCWPSLKRPRLKT
jgi:hypothetical protein